MSQHKLLQLDCTAVLLAYRATTDVPMGTGGTLSTAAGSITVQEEASCPVQAKRGLPGIATEYVHRRAKGVQRSTTHKVCAVRPNVLGPGHGLVLHQGDGRTCSQRL
jgi:hypothetical protein